MAAHGRGPTRAQARVPSVPAQEAGTLGGAASGPRAGPCRGGASNPDPTGPPNRPKPKRQGVLPSRVGVRAANPRATARTSLAKGALNAAQRGEDTPETFHACAVSRAGMPQQRIADVRAVRESWIAPLDMSHVHSVDSDDPVAIAWSGRSLVRLRGGHTLVFGGDSGCRDAASQPALGGRRVGRCCYAYPPTAGRPGALPRDCAVDLPVTRPSLDPLVDRHGRVIPSVGGRLRAARHSPLPALARRVLHSAPGMPAGRTG